MRKLLICLFLSVLLVIGAGCKTDDSEQVLHWSLSGNPKGWLTENITLQPSQGDYGNGLTLLSRGGNNNGMNYDSGIYHDMGIYPNQAIPSIGELGTPGRIGAFTKGALRVQGNGTWGRITGYKGPYRLTICYSSANSSNSRWPAVKIGSDQYNYAGELSKSAGDAGFALKITYNGKDMPSIYLKATAGIYIHDIYIDPLD